MSFQNHPEKKGDNNTQGEKDNWTQAEGFKSAMDVFKLLDKSNCRKCGKPTCLAFAASVFKGERELSDCPLLPAEVIEKHGGQVQKPEDPGERMYEHMESLKKEIAGIRLADRADPLGGRMENGKLVIRVMGKDFRIFPDGRISTDIHVNPWVAIPLLNYILYGKGTDPSGNWVPFRELPGGKDRYPLFEKRAEEGLKKLADNYTELFSDMMHLFSGKKVDNHYESDVALALFPLPKVPLLICYWKPEEGMGSSLNMFFDETAEENLDIGSIFSIGAGIVQMFEKIAMRHG